MKPQAFKWSPASRRETRGGNHIAAQFACELFDARGMIDRGSHDGEIQSRLRTNVAVGNFAQMQRQAKANFWLLRSPPQHILFVDFGASAARSSKRGFAALGRTFLTQLEYREHRVPYELQSLPALRGYSIDHSFEIFVQEIQDTIARLCVRQSGEIAQVAIPDDCMDALAAATGDSARQHPRAGAMPNV